MRKLLFFITLSITLLANIVSAKRVIRYPMFESSQIPEFKIDSICITNKETLVYFHLDNRNAVADWINISPETYIRDEKGEKYSILSLENIAKRPERTYILGKKEWNCIIHFPHIDSKTIDFIEDESNVSFNIYGIDLTKDGDFVGYVDFTELNRKLKMYDFFFTAKSYEKYIELATPLILPLYTSIGKLGAVPTLRNLEMAHVQMGNKNTNSYRQNYAQAELYAKDIWDAYYGKHDEDELFAMCEYGYLLKNNGKYQEAFDVFSLVKQNFSEQTSNIDIYSNYLRELADCYRVMGDIAQAYETGKESIRIFRDINKGKHDYSSIVNLSWAMKLQAEFCNVLGKYDEALSLIDESISLLTDNKNIVSDYNSRIARSMPTKSLILCDKGNINESYNVILECIAKMKHDTQCTSFDYANALDIYINVLCRKRLFSEALTICDEFINIITSSVGNNNERYLGAIEKKASIFIYLGEYADAEYLYNQAAVISKRLFGNQSIRYASTMNNVSICKYSLGDAKGALDISNNLCNIDNLTQKGNEGLLFQVIFQKAVNENRLKMLDLAIDDFKFALDILKRIEKNMDNSVYIQSSKATVLSNLALSYNLAHKKEDAMNSFNEAKRILEQSKLDNTLNYAEMVILQGLTNVDDSNDVSLYHKVAKIISNHFGKNNIMYLNALLVLTKQYIASEDLDSIICYSTQYYDAVVNLMENNKLNLSHTSRDDFWNQFKSLFNNDIPYLAYKYNNSALLCLAYNSALYNKCFLLNSNDIIKQTIFQSSDSLLIEHYIKYQNLQNLLYNNITSRANINYEELKESLKQEERFIISKCSCISEMCPRVYQWEDIQNALKEKEIAIEVISYRVDDDTRYYALCINNTHTSPFIVDLYEKSFTDSLIEKEGPLSQKTLSYSIAPFRDIIKNYTTIYVSPTDKLQFIPIENMIEEHTIYRVSSTKQVCTKKKNPLINASIYGGLDYNANVGSNKEIEKKQILPVDIKYISEDLTREGVEYLPGTLSEVNAITDILKNGELKVNKYIQNDGTEESFKTMSGNSPNIIHIATHGKYVQLRELVDYKKHKNYDFLLTNYDKNIITFDDFLLSHSYLVFAGGNMLFQHKELPFGVENGILTSWEISQLDLRQTDLVVLSACQSGLGTYYDGSNIGLQYGFKKAGVKSILMSLDNIDDKATQILMVEFYRNLLSGKSKHDSLRDAQRFLRTTENGKYRDPKYWASFILLDAID